LTGDGIISRDLPCGLSGCVTTPTTSKPSPTSARNAGAANSGVPQNATRTYISVSRWCAPFTSVRTLLIKPGYFPFVFSHVAIAALRFSGLR